MGGGVGQVTKRVDTGEGEWRGWNWRSDGDIMVNGAYFVTSGAGVEVKYEKAYSVEPKSAVLIDQLVMHAGALGVGGRFVIFPLLSCFTLFLSFTFSFPFNFYFCFVSFDAIRLFVKINFRIR